MSWHSFCLDLYHTLLILLNKIKIYLIEICHKFAENFEEIVHKTEMETKVELSKAAYIAGDNLSGVVSIVSAKPMQLEKVEIKLIGKGTTQYFKAKLRAQKLCEVVIPVASLTSHCITPRKAWKIPFSVKLDENFPSTMDSGKKGQVIYFLVWDVRGDMDTKKQYQEVTILANHPLDSLPRLEEMCGDNQQEEEFDEMKLNIYSPASAYLPGEKIQFRATVQNLGKKPVKKIAVLLLQNVLFFKSAWNIKGRTRSFLMTVKEKPVWIKSNNSTEWVDEIQIPDPVPPSADIFHKIDYELVLVAIVKGKKSTIRTVFDQARYHFDLEKFQDDYFRDFLPHACCYFDVGSHHGELRSASMSGAAPIHSLNDQWKQKTKEKSKERQLPRVESDNTVRLTFRP